MNKQATEQTSKQSSIVCERRSFIRHLTFAFKSASVLDQSAIHTTKTVFTLNKVHATKKYHVVHQRKQ